jgi:uncharacterized protein
MEMVDPRTVSIAVEQDRRDHQHPTQRLIGRVISCNGSKAVIAASMGEMSGVDTDFWSIGKLVSINTGRTRIVGLVYDMAVMAERWREDELNIIQVQLELVGEISDKPDGSPEFRRGIGIYPPLGAVAHRIRSADLRAVYDLGERTGVEVGRVSQDDTIPATVNVDDMLKRHFAVVGTTGVGKSTAVSILLRKVSEAKSNLRILILDPHNEYTRSFPDISVTIDSTNLELPFWLFRFDEICEVIFRGREIIEERDILRDLIPLAKARYKAEQQASSAANGLLKRPSDNQSVTPDTPVPYRMADLIKLIDDQIGQLEPRYPRYDLKSLKTRVDGLINDPRFRFMFGRISDDGLERVIGRMFRIPHEDRRITVLQMSGIPSDVVNACASVLARLSFDVAVWSGGACEVLVLCEEAHRYVPQDSGLGFLPTRQAIAKIAKEGRKYGCYLGIITQRPGELDPTILSQCSTIFAMRLANDRDQEIIRSAISDSSASTISFLSAIGRREAIAFGEGVATAMRMKFELQTQQYLPRAATDLTALGGGDVDLKGIVNRMRNQGQGFDAGQDFDVPGLTSPAPITAPEPMGFQPSAPTLPQQHFGSPSASPFGAGAPTLRKQSGAPLAPEPPGVQKAGWPGSSSPSNFSMTRFR